MNVKLKNYLCRNCEEETLSFTVQNTNQVGVVNLKIHCSNCSESYPTVKSPNREPHTDSHKDEIKRKLDLKQT